MVLVSLPHLLQSLSVAFLHLFDFWEAIPLLYSLPHQYSIPTNASSLNALSDTLLGTNCTFSRELNLSLGSEMDFVQLGNMTNG